jgi:hypothetical protein
MGRLKFPHRAVASAALLGLAGLFGCGSNYGPRTGVSAAYVDRGPPRNRVEVRGAAPGSGVVWLGGYWRWTGRDYDWVPGRWVPIERGYRSWSPGRWRHSRQGWYWVDGRWR